jgi:hypothetical protein
VHADQRTVSGPDQVMPAVPGPHGGRREGREGGHRGVPVAIQVQTVELLHGAGQLRVWALAEYR